MASWKNSIVVHAPPDKVFAYVDDPMNLVEWVPGMVEVRNVIGSGAGQQQEFTHKMAGLLLRGQAVVVEHVPGYRAAHQTIGMIHSIFAYSVEPVGEGSKLSLDVEYNVPIPVLGKLAEHIVIRRNAREFALALENVKERMEA
jgi:carbon monoxide dehydrogenase subunit G